jgi:hypothetical protein
VDLVHSKDFEECTAEKPRVEGEGAA